MIVTTESIDIPNGPRALLTKPKPEGRYPSILMYSDIFQVTGPQRRVSARLAGYGFRVLTPDLYRRIEPPGTALDFEQDRDRALTNAKKTTVAEYDADCHACIEWLSNELTPIASMGFCIGGHLAFRAAFHPKVRGSACFYPTGLQNGALGADADAGSLARAHEIHGELMLIFGMADPHIPPEGRAVIAKALANVTCSTLLFPAEHAFVRDEGPRHDPAATDQAWASVIGFLRHVTS